jgi:hypothetical protein
MMVLNRTLTSNDVGRRVRLRDGVISIITGFQELEDGRIIVQIPFIDGIYNEAGKSLTGNPDLNIIEIIGEEI